MAHAVDTTIAKDIYGLERPKLRGLIHAYAAIPFALAGMVLVVVANHGSTRASVIVYTAAITAMLSASAAYHRLKASEKVRRVLRKVDHSMIGVAVAGTYTPVVVLTATGFLRWPLLGLLWFGALGALALTLAWPQSPRGLRVLLYVVIGWGGIAVMPSLWDKAGALSVVLAAAGGLLYMVGAITYAMRKPTLSPRIFGFHELFHSLVIGAVACHFAMVAVIAERAG